MSLEENYCCLFCNCSTLSTMLYDVNGNSVLIGPQLIDLEEIIFDIFSRRINPSVINYICDECKEQLVQFYIFKENAKQNLSSSFFENAISELREFFNKNKEKEEDFELECTESDFIIRCKNQYEVENEVENQNYEPMYIESNLTDEEFIEETEEKYYAEVQDDSTMEHDIIQDTISEESESMMIKEEEEEVDMKIIVDSMDMEKVFTCDCGIQCISIKELHEHRSVHHKKRSHTTTQNIQYACDFCGIYFKEEKYSKLHEKAHESFEAILPQMPSYQCGECQILFSSEDDLITHTSLHESKIEHLEESLIERGSAFEGHFMRSDKSLSDDDYLSEEILFNCGHCGIRKSEFYIKMHLLFFHSNILYCPLDNRCFEGHKQIRQFPEHVKTKHPEIFDRKVEFICTCCSERFPTQFEKLAHMKVCNMKKYICEEHCGKRFKSEWLLNKHLKLVELGGDKRFTCSMCPKQCVSKSDLQIHMRSHTNERPYKCTICDKAFKTSANRSSHMDIHRDDKIHECNVCNQKFQTRPILRKHMKKHDQEYQNQCICQICKHKGYINRTHLLRHIKTTHLQPDLTIDQIDTFFQNYLMHNTES
ncbi:unnamed protein product [Chironomus riparius]|uniref:C2H2-type domain-containing protein n=1 Tax=Chironomus riparius TaxID=315576 RepID=A0A9N9RYE8_9DIPT|nr:unnamed protein product [Chironomus riparius]